MDDGSFCDVQYEGCFSGPAGVNGWLGGALGFIVGIIVGLLAAGWVTTALEARGKACAPPGACALAVTIGVWILCAIVCTVLFAVFFRMRKFTVLLRRDGLVIMTPRRARSIPYEQIRFIDAGIRVDSFDGDEQQNIRVCLHQANQRVTTIHLNRSAAYSLVGQLQQCCSRAGGIHFDGSDWMPQDGVWAKEGQRQIRNIVLIRFATALTVAALTVAAIAASTAIAVSEHATGGRRFHNWSQLCFVWMAAPFALRTVGRAARTWARYRQLARIASPT